MSTLNDDMGFRRLNPAIQYNLLVIKADYKSSFKQNGTDVYVYKLLFRDNYGYTYKAEYISEINNQQFFIPGKRATFRVIQQHSTKDDAVWPSPEVQDIEKKLVLSLYYKVDPQDVSLRSLQLAAEIFAAERGSTMHPIQEEDIDRMLVISDKIEDYLLAKMSIRAGDGTGM